MVWHEIYDPSNGTPIAYFKYAKHMNNFNSKAFAKSSTKKIEEVSHLEYIVKKKEKPLASFEAEFLAIQYNHMFLNGKGHIEPNPKK